MEVFYPPPELGVFRWVLKGQQTIEEGAVAA
jgi:hypothetical protein